MVAPVDASTFDLISYRKDLEAAALTDKEKKVSLWFLNLMSGYTELAQSWRILQSPIGRLSILIQRDGDVPSKKASFLFNVFVENGEIVCTAIRHSSKSLAEKINIPTVEVASFLESADTVGLTDKIVDFCGADTGEAFAPSNLFSGSQFGADIWFTKSRLYSVVHAVGQPQTDGDAVGLAIDNSKNQVWTENQIAITEPTVAQLDFKEATNLVDFNDAENPIHEQWVEFTDNDVSTYAYMNAPDISRVMSVQADVWMLDVDEPPIIGSFNSAASSNISLVGGLTVIPPANITVTKIAPFIYRIKASIFGDVTGTACGVICYVENIFRPFRVSGFNVSFLEGTHFYQDVLTARGTYHTAPEHVSLDAFDDNYKSALPEITNGQIVIATTTGIWADIFSHPGGQFEIGPDTFTGGPAGLMSFIGNDVIAFFIRNEALGKSDLEKLISFYRSIGAGPRMKLDTSLFQSRSGAILDVSDRTVMFEDFIGTKPVSGDGRPVGLVLDKSKGLQLGAEMLDNTPDFQTSWQLNNQSGKAGISGNIVTIGSGSGDRITKFINAEIGKSYVYTVKLRAITGIGSPIRIIFYDSSSGISGTTAQQKIITLDGSVQTATIIGHTVDNTASQIQIRGLSLPAEVEIISASLKHIAGNHFFQPVNAARLTFRTDGIYNWLEGDGVDDFFRFHPLDINNGAIAMAMKDRYGEIGVGTRVLVAQGADGYILSNGTLRSLGINSGGDAYFVDTTEAFTLNDKLSFRINKTLGVISAISSTDPVEHTNTTPGGTGGLTTANTLFAFSKNGEIPVKCDFYGMILLSENTTPLEDRLIFQWLNDRSGV